MTAYDYANPVFVWINTSAILLSVENELKLGRVINLFTLKASEN